MRGLSSRPWRASMEPPGIVQGVPHLLPLCIVTALRENEVLDEVGLPAERRTTGVQSLKDYVWIVFLFEIDYNEIEQACHRSFQRLHIAALRPIFEPMAHLLLKEFMGLDYRRTLSKSFAARPLSMACLKASLSLLVGQSLNTWFASSPIRSLSFKTSLERRTAAGLISSSSQTSWIASSRSCSVVIRC